MDVAEERIAAFLHFGYTPPQDYSSVDNVWFRLFGDSGLDICHDRDEEEMIEHAIACIEDGFRDVPEGLLVVPLSGGMESRIILGLLARHGYGDRMVAATFGTPGTYDFEIAPLVARTMGVKHEAIDLTSIPVTRDRLLKVSEQTPSMCWLSDVYYNRLICEMFGKNATYWSGVIGWGANDKPSDPTTDASWDTAKDVFCNSTVFSRRLRLTPPGYIPRTSLPREPLFPHERLRYADQLIFFERVPGYLEVVVDPPGYTTKKPFYTRRWLEYMFSVPHEYHVRQRHYKKIAKTLLPELFSLPLKKHYGLPVYAPEWMIAPHLFMKRLRNAFRRYVLKESYIINPEINYIDFDRAFVMRDDLRTLADSSIANLKKRNVVPWLDLEAIHRTREGDRLAYGEELSLLISLDINLEVYGE